MTRRRRAPAKAVGWREWVALPELGIERIKAKVDTGARSSALHAFDIVETEIDGRPWLRFNLHPVQRDAHTVVAAAAPLVGHRLVRPSTGRASLRPVIHTMVELGDESWPIEITLTRRDLMGFRLLLGRQALRRRFMVDPGRSFLGGESLAVVKPGRSGGAKGKRKGKSYAEPGKIRDRS